MSGWDQVASVLLGSWPAQVSSWSREAINAYVGELRARGLSPEHAIAGIRGHAGAFPPAAGEIASNAVREPAVPTFVEAFHMLFGYDVRGGRGVLWERAQPGGSRGHAQVKRAYELHSLLGEFVESYGLARLSLLEVDHEEHGGLVRRDLERAWDAFVEAAHHRRLDELAPGSAGPAPRKLDAVRALGITAEAGAPVSDEDIEF